MNEEELISQADIDAVNALYEQIERGLSEMTEEIKEGYKMLLKLEFQEQTADQQRLILELKTGIDKGERFIKWVQGDIIQP